MNRAVHPIIVELADTRRARRVSQQTVADRLGVSRPTVCTWETGQRHPDLDTVSAYADLLGLELQLNVSDPNGGVL